MNYTGGWQATSVRDATGGEAGFFVLPPIEPGGDAPVLGAPFMVGAIRDRPEVREFVRWLLDPEWGAKWAAKPDGSFFSANIHFDPDNCRSPELTDAANAVRVQLCETQRDTIVAGLQRPDASDEMPVSVGGLSDTDQRGAFLQGMLDYVNDGPESLDGVLAEIDAAWPQ
jgi:hypothetical protein